MQSYSSRTAITIPFANLASDANLLTGAESDEIDNTTNKYDDALVDGFITVGTTPTTAKNIIVYCWGANRSLATMLLDCLDGANSQSEAFTTLGVSLPIIMPLVTLNVDSNTSNRIYPFSARSVAAALGLPVLTPFWGLWGTHNTVAALYNNSANHDIGFVGVKY